jgi:hypothetical protein
MVKCSVVDPDPGSVLGFFRIPDLGFRISDPGSRIPDLGSRISDPRSQTHNFERLVSNSVLRIWIWDPVHFLHLDPDPG